ncbi:hypothetical protein XA68_17873 [Ophiocordyceps unilateralis]|uniref:phosphoserine phosphatase n=1 Tax=Ophiocordyceps unilateralis TaxID=268505 RepID=A0A2A9PIM5_OPHUN|nr:hypothetical protein XA68_17873 [Ophiocordyceps unilateralis]
MADAARQRPQLAASMRSSSYLSDLQQYRPPKPPHPGIDAVVADGRPEQSSSPSLPRPFNGIPSDDNPPTIVESGLSHALSHASCAPAPGRCSDRLVATLFYKHSASASNDASSAVHADVAPADSVDDFPLEPPSAVEAEQLDHLYGSYVSPLCVASFLHLMSTFPQPRDDAELAPHSSHRCLDSQHHPRIVELTLGPAPSPQYLSLEDLRRHEAIYRFEREWNVDVALQRDLVWRRHPRLVVFDMDSTLITQEVIELLAAAVQDPPDLAARVARITERAMRGELEFDVSFRERLALLRGLDASLFDDLQPILNLTPGAADLIRALRRLGVKTAVLSGGFQPLTEWLARKLGIDYAYANHVAVADGKLTGEVEGTIVGKERKRELLIEIAAKENIDMAQVVAVGDGANDLLMLEKAGLGIAWNAKPRVQLEADARLNGESLLDLLFLFGFTAEEIGMLVAQ